jgi:hypothetical protein
MGYNSYARLAVSSIISPKTVEKLLEKCKLKEMRFGGDSYKRYHDVTYLEKISLKFKELLITYYVIGEDFTFFGKHVIMNGKSIFFEFKIDFPADHKCTKECDTDEGADLCGEMDQKTFDTSFEMANTFIYKDMKANILKEIGVPESEKFVISYLNSQEGRIWDVSTYKVTAKSYDQAIEKFLSLSQDEETIIRIATDIIRLIEWPGYDYIFKDAFPDVYEMLTTKLEAHKDDDFDIDISREILRVPEVLKFLNDLVPSKIFAVKSIQEEDGFFGDSYKP